MTTQKAKERSQDSRRPELDDRYGKIGISAVAGAIHHKGEHQDEERSRQDEQRFKSYERD